MCVFVYMNFVKLICSFLTSCFPVVSYNVCMFLFDFDFYDFMYLTFVRGVLSLLLSLIHISEPTRPY